MYSGGFKRLPDNWKRPAATIHGYLPVSRAYGVVFHQAVPPYNRKESVSDREKPVLKRKKVVYNRRKPASDREKPALKRKNVVYNRRKPDLYW
jgi:hypothetical protein